MEQGLGNSGEGEERAGSSAKVAKAPEALTNSIPCLLIARKSEPSECLNRLDQHQAPGRSRTCSPFGGDGERDP